MISTRACATACASCNAITNTTSHLHGIHGVTNVSCNAITNGCVHTMKSKGRYESLAWCKKHVLIFRITDDFPNTCQSEITFAILDLTWLKINYPIAFTLSRTA